MPSITFNPSPELTQVLLERLASPNYSLTDIAASHDTTLEALVLWATRPDIQDRQRAIKGYAAERARSAAVSQLHVCVEALATSLHAYIKDEINLPPAHNTETAHTRDRLRSGARRANWHIQRIARSHPEIVPAELLNVLSVPPNAGPGSCSPTAIGADGQVRRRAPQPPPQPDLTQLTALFAAFLTHSGLAFQPMPAPPPSPTDATPSSIQPEGLAGSSRGLSDESSMEADTPAPSVPTSDIRHPTSDIDASDIESSDIEKLGQRPSQERVCLPDPTYHHDQRSTSATEALATRAFDDTPLTDPYGPTLADTASNSRALNPGATFNHPYRIPQRHMDRLEKAGRTGPIRTPKRGPYPAIPQATAHATHPGPAP